MFENIFLAKMHKIRSKVTVKIRILHKAHQTKVKNQYGEKI